MCDVGSDAGSFPQTQSFLMGRLVQSEQADRRVVETVQHVCAGTKIVHTLSEDEISRVKDGRPEPAHEAKVSEETIPVDHRIIVWEVEGNIAEASIVCIAIQDGEEDGEGFLDTEEASERPLAVKLLNGEAISDAFGGDGLLTDVVAVLGAGPEGETKMEGKGGRAFNADAALRDGKFLSSKEVEKGAQAPQHILGILGVDHHETRWRG